MYYQLSIYMMLPDDEPDLVELLMMPSKEECFRIISQIQGKLQANQYFEIFNDETQETIYVLNDGTIINRYQDLRTALQSH